MPSAIKVAEAAESAAKSACSFHERAKNVNTISVSRNSIPYVVNGVSVEI